MANAIHGGTPIPTTKVVPAQNVSPVETHATLNVRLKDYQGEGDGLAVINAHEFDGEIHEKVNEKGKADEKAKAKKFEFREELVEPTLDDNDLKELGPPKTKEEKDRLENVAKNHLAKADKGGRQRLRDDLEEIVGPDAMQGQQQLPPQMQPTGKIGPGVGVGDAEKAKAEKAVKEPLTTVDRPAGTQGERDATKADKQQLSNSKDEPPLTPRK